MIKVIEHRNEELDMSQSQIIFSEDLETIQNGKNNILKVINPILQLNIPFLPTSYSFALVAITDDVNFNEPHSIEVILKDPSSNVLYSSGIQQVPPLPNTDNLNFNLVLKNTVLKSEGEYIAYLIIDEIEVHKQILNIKVK
ncbi:DUF6941 family protein [Alkalibacterium sp. f15]|uniref:DUF6941 family protein n=1 Tax=Alkalibacterium sp. f15 TaxID=3414029 RepID=UPI003BF7E317